MQQYGYIGRKLRTPKLKEQPAIVLITFGSNRRIQPALDLFQKQVESHFPDHQSFWAYSSHIICRKKNLPSLQETLAAVEAAGYRKVVVQPLHIFPGTEYQQITETCEFFPGLRVFVSETLFHRWNFVKSSLDIIEREFLAPEEGLNLLALHGTPLVADPVNAAYFGLEKLVRDRYPNVLAAALEGVPDDQALFKALERQNSVGKYPRIKIIPMMYLAGMHAEEDLMGSKNSGSWRLRLEAMGHSVECAMAGSDDGECFKGLAYYPEIISFFMDRLQRSLQLAEHY
jgi:sirohydrochlorin cobaltochelatase